MISRVNIIVPFYKNPDLYVGFVGNVVSLAQELRDVGAEFIIVNDSPEDPSLREVMQKNEATLLATGFKFRFIYNPQNLGFIKSVNQGMEICIREGGHALLLNSDCRIAPGALKEMLEVLHLDPMIGFVNPRSDNATISSLPSIGPEDTPRVRGEDAYKCYQEIRGYLPRYQFTPTAVGFCMLIRADILVEFGVLDTVYGRGYNEENDFVFRANQCGYRSVLANHAYAFHEGSRSFTDKTKLKLDKKNGRVFKDRYPEYQSAIERYCYGEMLQTEDMLSRVVCTRLRFGGPTLAIDGRTIGPYQNGTFRACAQILKMLTRMDLPYKLVFLGKKSVAEYHGLAGLPGLSIVAPDEDVAFDVMVKIGQPFNIPEMMWANQKALRLFYWFLDTIAWDCQHLTTDELDVCWKLAHRWMNGILFISEQGRDTFVNRFGEVGVPMSVPGLSNAEKDYKVDSASAEKKYDVLLVGNHFKHKYVEETAKAFAAAFPDSKLAVLGMSMPELPSVYSVKSGHLSDAEVDRLYAESKVLLFPSHYEGFGFPVVEGLSRGMTVVTRESPVNREIARDWGGSGALAFYTTTRELIEKLPSIMNGETKELVAKSTAPKERDWWKVTKTMIDFVRSTENLDSDLQRMRNRFMDFQIFRAGRNPGGAAAAFYPSFLAHRTMFRAAARVTYWVDIVAHYTKTVFRALFRRSRRGT